MNLNLKSKDNKLPIKCYLDKALTELGAENPDVMLLTDDLREAIGCETFINTYPDRFLDMGIAEQNTIGMAAGMASCGKVPFFASYATFATIRVAEQLRNDISYTEFNVKIVSLTTGVCFGQGGMSHQTFEDISYMRTLPKFVVLVPSDSISTYELTLLAGRHKGPVFIRAGRDDEYALYDEGQKGFEIGGSNQLADGDDIALIACGFMVREALLASEKLREMGINARVIDMYSIKPIDKMRLYDVAKSCKAIMTIEEHFTAGGLGSAVMEGYDGVAHPPIKLKGIYDEFPPIGPKFELRDHLGLCADSIVEDALSFLKTI